MKKLTLVLVLLTLVLSSFAVSAESVTFEADYVKEGEFVLASFHSVKDFTSEGKKISPLEDACYWVGLNAKDFNVKYASFIGGMSGGSRYTYNNWSIPNGRENDKQGLIDIALGDQRHIDEFKRLKDMGTILTDCEIPYGVTGSKAEYVSNALYRDSLLETMFEASDFTENCEVADFIEFNSTNYCTVIENNGEKYLIFQLEAYPRADVCTWVSATLAENPDKRAIVYTHSFLTKDGEMYTQHSWTLSQSEWLKIYGTFNTTIRENLLNIDKPHEGDQLWNDAMAAHDNVLCVVSSNATVGKNIVTKVHQNNNGYDVLFVVANLSGGWGAEGKAFPVLMKISADNKTIDLRYADVDGMTYVEDSAVKITLDNIATLPEPDPVTVLPKIPYQYNGENAAYINGYEGNVFKPANNMTKAEACTIFARLLLGTQDIPSGYTTRFTDVKEGDWFYNAVAYLDETGYFYTIEGDKYNPNANITRAEFVELAYLSCLLSESKNVTFKDVDESNKYYKAIMAAAASGLVNGYGDGTFGPDKTITRAEVVTVINRVLGLLANDYTVNKAKLDRVFGDVAGHWAEYQILMASNSNVKGAYFDSIDKTDVTETNTTVEFATKHVKVVINKKGGKIAELINLATGKNVVNAATGTPHFAYLISSNGANIVPSEVDLLDDGRIVMTFKGGYKAYFIVDVEDNFFSVTLDNNLPSTLKGAIIGCVSTSEPYGTEPDSYRLSAISMNTNTNSINSASGSAKATLGKVLSFVPQTMGAKLGIAFGTYENIREYLKDIADAIDPAVGLTSTAGGPYALDNHDLFKDYVIMSSGITLNNVKEVSELAAKYEVGQIDIHQGGSTFIQADFNFKCALTDQEKENGVFGTAAMFKERVADIAHANGVQLGLHTYSSLVPTSATNILTNPTYQKQIITSPEVYTVRGTLSKFRINIKTHEDASGFKIGDSAAPWNGPYTRYVLIDEEIILVQQGTSSGFLNVKRGQLGTKPAEHKDGAEIRQFQGHYGMFQPIPGSDLFWHVADLTAKAYNEGDFDMIYLDGFESFARDAFSKSEERYYYYGEFARRIVSQCIKKPIMEYSSGAPTYLWNARGRGGATDSARRAYKQHKTNHRGVNMSYHNNFYTSTFGWFHFNPDHSTEFKNTLVKTMFRDDLDHTGSLAIIWDISTVNDSFSPTAMNQLRSEDNFAYYTVYSKLRLARYFAPELREQLKGGEYEYKVVHLDDGRWALREMKYCFNKVLDTTDDLFMTGKDNNPFDAQTPYVRIEQRYSTLGEEEVVLLAFDENTQIAEMGKKTIPTINISDKITLKIKVFGNGSETDAILLQLGAVVTAETGRNDYVIPLNFTGWREFIIADADNADYGSYTFSGTSHASQLNYETFRAVPNMGAVNSITVKLCGPCTGVKIDDLRACKTVDAPVKNPSVTIDGKTLTFNTELHSGEFVEYYPDINKAYHTYYEYTYNEETGKYVSDVAHAKEITVSGSITVPAGDFTYTYGAESMTEAPARARVGIGLAGATHTNPEGWEAPEVNIPEEFINYNLG